MTVTRSTGRSTSDNLPLCNLLHLIITEQMLSSGEKETVFNDNCRDGTSCRAGKANVPPDFEARGENRSLPFHFSMASFPVVRLKFGEN